MQCIPLLTVNVYLVTGWQGYAGVVYGATMFEYIISAKTYSDLFSFAILRLAVDAILPVFCQCVIFAVNEKMRKELFVLNFTNARTKRE